MTSESIPGAEWIQAWIAAQKAAVDGWAGGHGVAGSAPGVDMREILRKVMIEGQPAATPGPGDQLASMWKAFGFPPSFGAAVGMEVPGIGPLREVQAVVAGLSTAMADHQRLAAELSVVMAKVHIDTLDLLARRAAEQANSGAPITTFKALYALWIECGEATYAGVVQGDAYCRLQAELSNAGIRVRGLEQQLVERWLKQLDLPTRSELNTLHRKVRDLTQEVAALRAEKAPPVPSPAVPRRQPVDKPAPRPARKARKPGKGT